jgi:hypothetical protein
MGAGEVSHADILPKSRPVEAAKVRQRIKWPNRRLGRCSGSAAGLRKGELWLLLAQNASPRHLIATADLHAAHHVYAHSKLATAIIEPHRHVGQQHTRKRNTLHVKARPSGSLGHAACATAAR